MPELHSMTISIHVSREMWNILNDQQLDALCIAVENNLFDEIKSSIPQLRDKVRQETGHEFTVTAQY